MLKVEIANNNGMPTAITICDPAIDTEPGFEKCPYINVCLARLNDRTIAGCGIPLYLAGSITEDEIVVRHIIKEEKDESK